MAVTSPSCTILTSSPCEGKAKSSRLLGARARFPFKMALSNESRTPETREAGSAAVDGRLPPLRQLDIDPSSLTLSSGWERSPRRRRAGPERGAAARGVPSVGEGAAPEPGPAPLPPRAGGERRGEAPGSAVAEAALPPAELPRSRSSRRGAAAPAATTSFPFHFPPLGLSSAAPKSSRAALAAAGQCRARAARRGDGTGRRGGAGRGAGGSRCRPSCPNSTAPP